MVHRFSTSSRCTCLPDVATALMTSVKVRDNACDPYSNDATDINMLITFIRPK